MDEFTQSPENQAWEPAPIPFAGDPGADDPKVHLVLAVQVGLSLLFALLGSMLFAAIATLAGWDISSLNGNFPANASMELRWEMRLMLGLGHFTTFFVAALATVMMFYKGRSPYNPSWSAYLRIQKIPSFQTVGLALLLMLVSIPLVLFSFSLNKMLPIPASWHLMESQTDEALKGLLQMNNPVELLGNLVIIALLPAIGEELVFRGVLQQQLLRRMKNPWVALLVSACVFSFIHFQFEGFLPRVLLGFILGWLYWKTQNFWVPVAAHFFNNGLQVFGQYLYGQKVSTIDFEQDIEVPWFAALVSAFMIFVVARLIYKLKD
ncbi:MAG: CPBP family intramembrane glutamic endopeptidase [Bacteroidota bacterium]